MDVVPLTPTVVDCVTFDRAPLGRRGYNEDQVDDFLDRVQATLAGRDSLTAQNVRDVEFDPAAFIRRGYNEDQVDAFLDLVVEELNRREGNPSPPATPRQPQANTQLTVRTPIAPRAPRAAVPPFTTQAPVPPWQVPPPTAAEMTAPMLFSQPPSMPAPGTQPVRAERQAASGPPESILPAATDKTAGQLSESPTGADPATNGKPVPDADETSVIPAVEPVTDTQPAVPDDSPAADTTDSPAGTVAEPGTPAPAASPLPEAEDPATTAEAPATAVAAVEPSVETEPAIVQPAETPPAAEPPDAAAEPAPSQETPPASEEPAAALRPSASHTPIPDAWRDSEHLALPLPPAPPGDRGYRPGDVERLTQFLAATLDSDEAPDPVGFAEVKLSRTFFVGQGYHVDAVDALRQAWLDELIRRAR